MSSLSRLLAGLFLSLVVIAPPAIAQIGPLRKKLAAAVTEDPGAPEQVRESLLAAVAGYPDPIITDIFDVAVEPQVLLNGIGEGTGTYQAACADLTRYPEVLELLRAHPLSSRAIGWMARKDREACWNTIRKVRQQPEADPAPIFVEGANALPSAAVVAPTAVAGGGVVTGGVVVVSPTASGTSAQAGVVAYSGEHAAHAGGAVVATDGDGQIKTASAGGTLFVTPGGVSGAAAHAGTSAISPGSASSAQGAAVVLDNGQAVGAARSGSTQWGEGSYSHDGQGTVQSASGAGGTWSRSTSGHVSADSAGRSASTQVATRSGETVSAEHTSEVTSTGSGYDVDRSTEISSSSGASYSHSNKPSASPSSPAAAGQPTRVAQSAPHPPSARSFDSDVLNATKRSQAEFSKAEKKLSAGAGQKPPGSAKPSGRPGHR
ncbi:MAG: hypothetical protein WCS65_11350 [Verrucomicrobiae bacterium]